MPTIFLIFLGLTTLIFFGIFAYHRPHFFLYLFLLGLPFDHITFPVGPLSVSISDFSLVVLIIAWFSRFFLKGEREIHHPVQLYLGLMLTILVVGATFNNYGSPINLSRSFSFIVKIGAYILMLQFIRDDKVMVKSLIMIVIGATLANFLAIYQEYAFLTGGMAKLKTVIAQGTRLGFNLNIAIAPLRPPAGMNHIAAFGSYLIFPLAFLLGIYFFHLPARYKWWAVIPTLLLIVVVLINDTRAAYFGLLTSSLLCIVLSNNRMRYTLVFIVLMAPILVVPVYKFLFYHREISVITRQKVMPLVLEFAIDNPLGGGILYFDETNKMELGAHSSFLQMLTYGGLPAMFLYLMILISIAMQIRRAFAGLWKFRGRYLTEYALLSILLATFAGILICSELVHPRAASKDHWAFLAIFYLTPLITKSALRGEEENEINKFSED